MELKEKWICPNAEVQLFTPQEYVAACYTYSCHGSDGSGGKTYYIYPKNGNQHIGTIHHKGHTIKIKIENGSSLPQFHPGDLQSKDNHGGGNNVATGYYFEYNGEYHFVEDKNFTPAGANNAS